MNEKQPHANFPVLFFYTVPFFIFIEPQAFSLTL